MLTTTFFTFFSNVNPKIKKQHKKTLCNFQKSKMKCENTKKVNLLHTSKYFCFFISIIIPLICRHPTTMHYIDVSMSCVYGWVSREFCLHRNPIKRSSEFPKSKKQVIHLSHLDDEYIVILSPDTLQQSKICSK